MKDKKMTAFTYAFPKTLPVLVGYLFLGAAYGILMKVNGFGLGWVLVMSLFIFAGSLQYVGITMLVSVINPWYAFLMGLMINARHLFYGISMLKQYKETRVWKPYLIFGLTDETFSVLCQEQVPKQLDKEKVYLWVTLLDHSYWVLGSLLGVMLGSMITFNTKGLDFALTALFVVIFVDQWKSQKEHRPAFIGLLASALCVIVFGADSFIIPAMILILAILTWDYKKERKI